MKKTYFRGLYGLRFIAAGMVFVRHVEQIKATVGYASWYEKSFVRELGDKGVTLFLVLSGFLVTFFLLSELRETNTINTKKFYKKRILRIYPLYYLILFLSFFLLPTLLAPQFVDDKMSNNFGMKFFLFLFMLPNVALSTNFPVWGMSQTWVVGVEEQWYLFWPKIVRVFHKNFIVMCVLLIALKSFLQAIFKINQQEKIFHFLFNFLQLFQIEAIILGGLAAYILLTKGKTLKIIIHPAVNLVSVIFFIFLFTPYTHYLYFIPIYHHIDYLVSPGLAAIIIINITRIKYDYGKELGKISYGIYMFHVSVILFLTKILLVLNINHWLTVNVVLYLISMVMTIYLAKLSYRFFEARFLQLKNK